MTSQQQKLTITPGNAQHIGAREEQQDAFGFSDIDDRAFYAHGGVLALVADGMGGMSLGREAARTAVSTFLSHYMRKTREEPIPGALEKALSAANQAVYDLARKRNLEDEIGTTLVAAVLHGDSLHWISAGDSRLYLLRSGSLVRMTTDHLYANELSEDVKAGKVSAEDAEAHPDRDALTSFLGMAEVPETDRSMRPFPLEPGDRIILCTDGIYGSIAEKEMAKYLAAAPPQQAVENLVRAILDKQRLHQDNLTLAMLMQEPFTPQPRIRPWILTALLILSLAIAGGYFYYSAYRQSSDPPVTVAPVSKPAPSAENRGFKEIEAEKPIPPSTLIMTEPEGQPVGMEAETGPTGIAENELHDAEMPAKKIEEEAVQAPLFEKALDPEPSTHRNSDEINPTTNKGLDQ